MRHTLVDVCPFPNPFSRKALKIPQPCECFPNCWTLCTAFAGYQWEAKPTIPYAFFQERPLPVHSQHPAQAFPIAPSNLRGSPNWKPGSIAKGTWTHRLQFLSQSPHGWLFSWYPFLVVKGNQKKNHHTGSNQKQTHHAASKNRPMSTTDQRTYLHGL